MNNQTCFDELVKSAYENKDREMINWLAGYEPPELKNIPPPLECMNKSQLKKFISITLDKLEKKQTNKNILDLFYATTLLYEKFGRLITPVLSKLRHALTLTRFSTEEKAKLADYLERLN